MNTQWLSRYPGWVAPLALLAILLLSALLRLHGIDYGLPALNDPDELMFELGATRMITSGTMNPGWFGHPATTTMYVLAAVNAATFAVGWLSGTYANLDAFLEAGYANPGIAVLPGRVAIAAFGVLCVWQTFRLGKQVGGAHLGVTCGLLASLLLATSPVHVSYSQIIRSDMMGTAFMLLCLGSAARITKEGRLADYRWAALWLALAIATKWPFALASLSVLGATLWRFSQPGADRTREIRALAEFAGLSAVALLVISPHLLLSFGTVLANISGEARTQHLGSTGGSPLENAWWYLRGPLRDGLSLPGLLLAAGGMVLIARNRRLAAVLLPVMLSYAIVICSHGLRWERWALPMLPLLSIAVGLAVAWSLHYVRDNVRVPALVWLLLLLLLAIPVALAVTSWAEATARTNDTRQQASVWAERNIPPGSTVMIEHFAFDLFDQPWTVLFPLGEAGCINAHEVLAGRIDHSVIEQARNGRSNVDYGTLPPAVRQSCTADFAIVTQMDRYAAEQTRFPEGHASYQQLLQTMSVQASFTPEYGHSSGPTTRVLINR